MYKERDDVERVSKLANYVTQKSKFLIDDVMPVDAGSVGTSMRVMNDPHH